MLVFVLVAKSKHPLKSRKINRLVAKFDSGQGHQAENTTITISYTVGSISYFQRTLSRRVENTRKSSPQPSDLLAFLLVSRENKRSRRLSLFRTRNSADGPQERWRVRQPQADQDRRRLPRRASEIQRGRVELPILRTAIVSPSSRIGACSAGRSGPGGSSDQVQRGR